VDCSPEVIDLIEKNHFPMTIVDTQREPRKAMKLLSPEEVNPEMGEGLDHTGILKEPSIEPSDLPDGFRKAIGLGNATPLVATLPFDVGGVAPEVSTETPATDGGVQPEGGGGATGARRTRTRKTIEEARAQRDQLTKEKEAVKAAKGAVQREAREAKAAAQREAREAKAAAQREAREAKAEAMAAAKQAALAAKGAKAAGAAAAKEATLAAKGAKAAAAAEAKAAAKEAEAQPRPLSDYERERATRVEENAAWLRKEGLMQVLSASCPSPALAP